MCGIVGVFAPVERDADAATVERMAATLRHRGPDDDGSYVDPQGRAALGFRRLSIIDLTGGHQPMANEDGSLRLVFNGEIYNYRELRAWLERAGHHFTSRSDSETLLHAYEEVGDACVDRLRGMFAFAIWDARRGRVFAARDRIGIKPLYWTLVGGRLLLASEIKALLLHPGVRAEVDEVGLYHYLTFLATPAPRTLFRGINKLPAGHTLTFGEGGDAPSVRAYWDAIVEPDRRMTFDDAALQTRALVEDAVRSHMISDVPFGAFLSGGVDSSTNVALMSQAMDRPADTFSIGFADHSRYQEFGPAERVARLFGTDHRERRITLADALACLPALVHHQDEPLADSVCVPLYLLAQLMREDGVVVGHVGEGADELYFGYAGYTRSLRAARAVGRLGGVPRGLWAAAARGAGAVARISGRGAGAALTMRRRSRGERLFWGGAIAFDDVAKREGLLAPGLARRLNGLSSHDEVVAIGDRLQRERPEADLVDQMIYQDMKLRLPELLLMRVDKMTMANSIEARVPFLDHILVEHALSIPSQVKLEDGPKGVLKKAVEGLIPDDIIRRPKQGFDAPTSAWFSGALGAALPGLMARSAMGRADILRSAGVDHLVGEHREGQADHSVRLWAVLNLLLWWERWIAGGDVSDLLGEVAHAAA